MIHISDEKIHIEGNEAEIMADLTMAIRCTREAFKKQHGKEIAEKHIDKIIELSKKSVDEIRKEAMDLAGKQAERFLEKNFGEV